jgi:predicted amidohydrolase YtcJ
MSLFFSNVEVDAVRCSVLVEDATVVAIGTDLVRPSGARHIDGDAGALLPGLHDHHVHLLSSAASLRSFSVGPPSVRTVDEFRRVLRDAASTRRGAWIRAVGYHESVAGSLDRHALDQIVTSSPMRVQHRSGAMWFFNSLGLVESGLTNSPVHGLERDDTGQPTGRLFRGDQALAFGEAIGIDDLRAVGDAAVRRGVTGFTDAAPNQTVAGIETLVSAHQAGAILQHLTLMCPPGAVVPPADGVDVGPVKVLLDDVELPALDDLVETVGAAHHEGRAVAIHCVTDLQTALALSAISAAGPIGTDRIEHGAIMPVEFDRLAKACQVTIVTQPHFIHERGDQYLRDVPEQLHDVLYRARTLIDAGIAVAGGTDAPFGSSDPWDAVTAATRRTTSSGQMIGQRERLTPVQALNLFTGDARALGRPRRVEVGARADLCLLSLDTASALEDLSSTNVRATVINGRIAFER